MIMWHALQTIYVVSKIIWKNRKARIFHYHLVFLDTMRMHKIVYKHLHKAELLYTKEVSELIKNKKGEDMAKGKNKPKKNKKKGKKK